MSNGVLRPVTSSQPVQEGESVSGRTEIVTRNLEGVVECCFPSTETVGLAGVGSPGRPPWLHAVWLHAVWAVVADDHFFITLFSVRSRADLVRYARISVILHD